MIDGIERRKDHGQMGLTPSHKFAAKLPQCTAEAPQSSAARGVRGPLFALVTS